MSNAISVVNRSTTLCLACSSSLPPSNKTIFVTACCSRPICPTCLSNPRLARYNPCLACLGGVGAVSLGGKTKETTISSNIDGAVRDEDTFMVGDDEDEDEDENDPQGDIDDRATVVSSIPPPPYNSILPASCFSSGSASPQPARLLKISLSTEPQCSPVNVPVPVKYYIQSGDNLRGIALRFGIDGRKLCRLNKLPPSTLSTTPHILHTRSFLILPPSCKGSHTLPSPEDEEREQRRARERAEKRLQTLTKEVDWRVAKAYVAIADDPEEMLEFVRKVKESDSGTGVIGLSSSLEVMAVGRYLDDEEWEQRQRRDGRVIQIDRFP